ncbi:MAG: hypothetical protein RDU20_17970, partial [Desulfomonilaceae bacterium]|nr:hypothetical protein [Desulfomonilaceae bacterium]
MNNLAALIDEKSKDWIDLEASLASLNYRTRLVRSVEELEKLVDRSEFRVVIVDLDLIGVDNRFFRSLKKINPQLNILTVARDPYHPELKEALT